MFIGAESEQSRLSSDKGLTSCFPGKICLTQVPPSRRDPMFIERARSEKFSSLQRSETEAVLGSNPGNIALRWSAGHLHNRLSINI